MDGSTAFWSLAWPIDLEGLTVARSPLLTIKSAVVRKASNTDAEREQTELDDPLEAIGGRCVVPYRGTQTPIGSLQTRSAEHRSVTGRVARRNREDDRGFFPRRRRAPTLHHGQGRTTNPFDISLARLAVPLQEWCALNVAGGVLDMMRSWRDGSEILTTVASMIFRLTLTAFAFFGIFLSSVAAQTISQLRLENPLDFPQEGYCVDVVGVASEARVDLPLVAHNCLPGRESVDRYVVVRDGRLYMPAFDACLTAFGVVTALPGSPVILRPCGVREHFLPADQLQRFEWTGRNRLRLAQTKLCLTVGADAHGTFSTNHRWRTLTMEPCGAERQVWLHPR